MKPQFIIRMTILILILTAVFFVPLQAIAAESMGRLSPKAGICVHQSQTLFKDGRIEAAIDKLETFLSSSGNTAGADRHYICFLLGNYYSTLPGNKLLQNSAARKKAVQYYRAALKESPCFTAAWLNLAKCCYDDQNYADAAKAFEKGYQSAQTPKADHLYYAAVCYFQSGDSPRALTLFNTIIKDHPDKMTLDWKEVLVNVLFSLDQYKKALPHIEQLAQQYQPPKQKQWQEILLHQYLNLEMDAKALAYAKELTRTDPLEPKWWKALSHVYLKKDQIKRGLSALMIYGYLTPMTPDELKLAADLYLSTDVPLQAVAFYENALKQANDPKTLKKLAQAFVLAFEPENALKIIDNGLIQSTKTPDPELLMLKAQILYGQKSYEKAADTYAQITQSNAPDKTCANACIMLGYASMNCSQLDRADQAFKKAATYKTHKKDALKALASVRNMKAYVSAPGNKKF